MIFPFLSLICVFGKKILNSGSTSFILQLVIFCLLLVFDLGFGGFHFLYGWTGFLIVKFVSNPSNLCPFVLISYCLCHFSCNIMTCNLCIDNMRVFTSLCSVEFTN